MSEPSLHDLAGAAEASYKKGNFAPENYSKVEHLSYPEVSTYKHNVNPHYIVAHRGTHLGDESSAKKDVKADLNIALGNKNADALHKRRLKETEKIVKAIKKKEPAHDIHLVGHSLGGSTSSHALAHSDVVRENVKAHHTFNAGSSALASKPEVSAEVQQQLMEKSTHHRVRGDLISEHVKSNLIGKHKEYESTKKPSIAQHILKLATPILKRTLVGKVIAYGAKKALGTLQAHSLENFIKKKKM